MNSFFDRVYFNNTIHDYIVACGIIVAGTLLLFIFRRSLLRSLVRWSERTSGSLDNVIVNSIERFGTSALQFAIIYWGLSYLQLSAKTEKVIHVATSLVVTYFILRLISTIILIVLQNRIRRQQNGETKIRQLGGLMLMINIIIWITGVVFLLDNLGYDVTAIVTGLGIGGIAIALAAQNILGDLFNYFVIFFDRPFEAGDFIIVDDKMGTVEYVGIKTTRIRSLNGEQIIIGNSNLTGSRIHNYQRLVNRRVVLHLNIDYRTSPQKLKIVPDLIRRIIDAKPDVRFDRAHWMAFGDWSLKFETVYIFLNADYTRFMDTQQQINLEIYEALLANEVYFVTAPHVPMAPPKPEA
ncbi:MAG TPA: mechanosensitive ion channel domain-containing protein [Chryseosolibacter sp.]|nr:mechanosensitive ion channel domain-containing protein [Chryseosolibacter sp.]